MSAKSAAQDGGSPTVAAQDDGDSGVSPRGGGVVERLGVITPSSSFRVNLWWNDGTNTGWTRTADASTGWRVTRPYNPTRAGYVFAGWFDTDSAGNLTSPFDFSRPVTRNMDLKVRWDTFSLDSGDRDSSGVASASAAGGGNVAVTAPHALRFSRTFIDGTTSAGIDVEGGLWWWGYDNIGLVSSQRPARVVLPTGVAAVDVVADAVVLGSDGRVYPWRVSSGVVSVSLTPVALPAGERVVQVSGYRSVLAMLTASGHVFMWDAVSGAVTTVALPSNVHVVRMSAARVGCKHQVAYPDGSTGPVDGGKGDVLAVGDDGNVYAWGDDNFAGQLGAGVTASPDSAVLLPALPSGVRPVDVGVSDMASRILGDDGNVYEMGSYQEYDSASHQFVAVDVKRVPTMYPHLPPSHAVVRLSTSGVDGYLDETVALMDDGSVYQWFDGNNGRAVSLPGVLQVASLTVTGDSILVVASDGTPYAWGSENSDGQLGDGTTSSHYDAPVLVTPVESRVSGVVFDVGGASPSSLMPASRVDAGGSCVAGVAVPSSGVWCVGVPSHGRGVVDVGVSWGWVVSSMPVSVSPDPVVSTVLSGAFRFLASYTVSFNMVGARPQVPSQRVLEGHLAVEPDPTSMDGNGWVFRGWEYGSAGNGTQVWDFASMRVTGDVRLTANWAYFLVSPTVGDPAGGTRVRVSVPVTNLLVQGYGSKGVTVSDVEFDGVSSPSAPVAVAGQADVWEVEAPAHARMGQVDVRVDWSGGGVSMPPFRQVNGFTYASAPAGSHAVVFALAQGQGGTPPAVQVVPDGSRVSRPSLSASPRFNGKAFTGWWSESAGSWFDFGRALSALDPGVVMVDEGFDWCRTLTASVPAGGGSDVEVRVPPHAPWLDVQVTSVSFGDAPAASAPSRDGSDPDVWHVASPALVPSPGVQMSVFLEDAAGGQARADSSTAGSLPVAGETVGFDPQGGTWPASGPKSFQTSMAPLGTGMDGATGLAGVDDGSPVRRPADPTRDGYVFLGWYAPAMDTQYDFTQAVDHAFTLSARWGVFHVSPDDGYAGGGFSVALTAPANAGPGLTVTGVRFGDVEADGSTLHATSTPGVWEVTAPAHATGKTEVHVHWAIPSTAPGGGGDAWSGSDPSDRYSWMTFTRVTVSFDPSGDCNGSSCGGAFPNASDGAPEDTGVGGTVARPPDPSARGMQFDGWYTGDGRVFDFAKPLTADVTLTARYSGFRLSPSSGPYGGGTRVSLTSPNGARYVGVATVPDSASTSGPATDADSYGVTADGRVYAWGGSNAHGQLGDGTTAGHAKPAPVVFPQSGVRVRSVAAGTGFALALDSEGHVWSWGGNASGQLGDGSTLDRHSPVLVDLSVLPAGVRVRSVSAGDDFATAVCSDGRVYAWGSDSHGELGSGSVDSTAHAVPSRVPMPSGVKIRSVSSGEHHVLALASDGGVWAWGANELGQSTGDGVASMVTAPVRVSLPEGMVGAQVAAGGAHSLVLARDDEGNIGAVYGWGCDSHGELGDGNTGDVMAVRAMQVPAGVQVASVSGSYDQSWILDSDGDPYMCGMLETRRVGASYTSSIYRTIPVKASMPAGVHVSMLRRNAAVDADGRIWSWPASPEPLSAQSVPDLPVTVQGIKFDGASGSVLSQPSSSGSWSASSARWPGFPHPLVADVTFEWSIGGAPQTPVTLPSAFTYMLLTGLPFTGGRGVGPLGLASLTGLAVALLGLAVALLAHRRNRQPSRTTATHAAV